MASAAPLLNGLYQLSNYQATLLHFTILEQKWQFRSPVGNCSSTAIGLSLCSRNASLLLTLLLKKSSVSFSFSCYFSFSLYKNCGFLLNSSSSSSGDIPAATAEDVDVAVQAARSALTRNKGKDWAFASGAVRAKYLRAIAAKVIAILSLPLFS